MMTRDELMQRKAQARQEREFHLMQAGVALGIESECERLIGELPIAPAGSELPLAPASGPSSAEPS